MPYVRRSYQRMPIQEISGVMTKIHGIGYSGTLGLKDDLAEICPCIGQLPRLEGCSLGFLILHRVDDTVYVTYARWIDTNVLRIQMAKWLRSGSISIRDFDESIELCVYDAQVLMFERNVYVNYMIVPDSPHPQLYLETNMLVSTV